MDEQVGSEAGAEEVRIGDWGLGIDAQNGLSSPRALIR